MSRVISLIVASFLAITLYAQKADSVSNKVTKSNSYSYDKFRFGGYGEILYQRMDFGPDRYNYDDGSQPDKRAVVDIPRMVLSLDYRFNSKFEFATEIEFEHGGSGSAMEIEYEEFGEYEAEVEKGGEVVMEQMHLTYKISDALQIRAGHMIIPIGATNARHLPIQYFGTVRPEGERTIIPLTWHETGIGILGDYKKWHYEALIVNGLDANGFSSAEWVRTGRQKVFEQIKATNLAFVGRIENKIARGIQLGASFYIGNSTANTAKPEKMEHINGRVAIGTFDFEINKKNILVRGNAILGDLSDSEEISRINKGLSKTSPYPRTPVAKNATTYSLEAGYNILNFWNTKQKLYPFARYEYYNAMEATEGNVFADARHKRNVLTFGANYFLLPNLAFKADYSSRQIDSGNYNQENTIGIAIVYSAWFIQK